MCRFLSTQNRARKQRLAIDSQSAARRTRIHLLPPSTFHPMPNCGLYKSSRNTLQITFHVLPSQMISDDRLVSRSWPQQHPSKYQNPIITLSSEFAKAEQVDQLIRTRLPSFWVQTWNSSRTGSSTRLRLKRTASVVKRSRNKMTRSPRSPKRMMVVRLSCLAQDLRSSRRRASESVKRANSRSSRPRCFAMSAPVDVQGVAVAAFPPTVPTPVTTLEPTIPSCAPVQGLVSSSLHGNKRQRGRIRSNTKSNAG